MLSRTRLLPLLLLLAPIFTRTGRNKRERARRERQKTFSYSAFPVLLLSAILFVGSSAGLAWAEDERSKACRTAAGFDEKDVFDITQRISQPRVAIRLCQAAIQDNPEEDSLKAYLGWALYSDGRNAEARQWIEQSKGSIIGRTLMGLSYEYGIGIPKDLKQADEWYGKGHTGGWSRRYHPIAATQTGLFDLNGWGGNEKNPEYAYNYFKEAAEQGYDRASFFLGNLLREGLGTKKDVFEAMDWYKKAAMKGHADALQALKDLASDGYAKAYTEIALVYKNAAAPLRNLDSTRAWAKKAVAEERAGNLHFTDNPVEQYNLAIIHGMNGQDERAVFWLQKSAEQGNSHAQLLLAIWLEEGRGVKRDLYEADRWYRKSARQGNKTAMAALETLYRDYPEIERKQQNSSKNATQGAFCECDEPDAFPGNAKVFTRIQLILLKEAFETEDPRQKIDRTAPRFQQLNAIGQVGILNRINGQVVLEGFGTGILLPGNLVLTNAHVADNVGRNIQFNIGQTEPGNPQRWADTVSGKVVTLGSMIGSTPEDWALIKLDTTKTNWNEKYGSIIPSMLSEATFKKAGQNGQLMTAGYPGFKDPRYLWGQTQVSLANEEQLNLKEEDKNEYGNEPLLLNSATSSGMSGGAVLYEHKPGQFKLVGLVRGSKGKESNLISYNGLGFNPNLANFVNFKDTRFSKEFGKEYKKF